jgi:hypothetical protein
VGAGVPEMAVVKMDVVDVSDFARGWQLVGMPASE